MCDASQAAVVPWQGIPNFLGRALRKSGKAAEEMLTSFKRQYSLLKEMAEIPGI